MVRVIGCRRSCRLGGALGLAVAGLAALVAVVAAAWAIRASTQTRASMRAADTVAAERVERGAGDGAVDREAAVAAALRAQGRPPAPLAAEMLHADGDEGVYVALDEAGLADLTRRVVDALDDSEALADVSLGGRDALAEAVRRLVGACAAGDRAAYDAVLASLGAPRDSARDVRESDLFGVVSSALADATIGLDRVRVGGALPPPMTLEEGFAGTMMMVNRQREGDGPEETTVIGHAMSGGHVSARVMNFGESGLRGVAVGVPFRRDGGAEGVVSFVMVWVPEAGAWQPARAVLAFGAVETARLVLPMPGGQG